MCEETGPAGLSGVSADRRWLTGVAAQIRLRGALHFPDFRDGLRVRDLFQGTPPQSFDHGGSPLAGRIWKRAGNGYDYHRFSA